MFRRCWFFQNASVTVVSLLGIKVMNIRDRTEILGFVFGRFGIEEGDRSLHARAVVFSELLKPKSVITEGVEIVEPGLDLGF